MDQQNSINLALVEIEELEAKIAPDDPSMILGI